MSTSLLRAVPRHRNYAPLKCHACVTNESITCTLIVYNISYKYGYVHLTCSVVIRLVLQLLTTHVQVKQWHCYNVVTDTLYVIVGSIYCIRVVSDVQAATYVNKINYTLEWLVQISSNIYEASHSDHHSARYKPCTYKSHWLQHKCYFKYCLTKIVPVIASVRNSPCCRRILLWLDHHCYCTGYTCDAVAVTT